MATRHTSLETIPAAVEAQLREFFAAQRDTVAHVSPRPGTEMRRDDLITVQMYDFNLLNLVR